MNYPLPIARLKEILEVIMKSPIPSKWGDITLHKCVVRLQNELNNFSLHKSASEPTMVAGTIPQVVQDSSPDTPQPAYDLNKGWITGILGCLRPVLSIIGKGAVNEIKNIHQGELT
jgi:hypothetical protein